MNSLQVQKSQLSSQQVIEIIKNNIEWLKDYNKNQTKSKRNLLNKWFLDSIKNYFMEQHAAVLLVSALKCSKTQQVKEQVHSNIDQSIPKYMSILKNYFDLLNKYGKVDQFKQNLIDMLSVNLEDFSCTTNQANYVIQKTIRKQFVGLLVLTYCNMPNKFEINSFYDLWNIIFPNDIQTKMRLSKYDILNGIEKSNKNKNTTKKISKQKRCISSQQSQSKQQQDDIQQCEFQSLQIFSQNTILNTPMTSSLNSTSNLYQSNNAYYNSNISIRYSVQEPQLQQQQQQVGETEEDLEQDSFNTYCQEQDENNEQNDNLNANFNQIQQKTYNNFNYQQNVSNSTTMLAESSSSFINQESNININKINYQNNNIMGQQQQQQQQLLKEQQNRQLSFSQMTSQIDSPYYPQQSNYQNSNNQYTQHQQQQQQQQQQIVLQENPSQVTSQNLKQLGYFYSVSQNEKQGKEQNQNMEQQDNHSSLSVNLNSEPEFYSSTFMIDQDFEINQINDVQDQYQNNQKQVIQQFEYSKYQINYSNNNNNKKEEFQRMPAVPEVQQYLEYPLYMNDQCEYFGYQQQDYNIYYDNQNMNNYPENQEQYSENFYNRQLL